MSQSRDNLDALIELYDDVFDREAWHGPALFRVLEGLMAEEAIWKPEPYVHSIWEIVLHIQAWERWALRFLKGETVQTLSPEEDFPKVEKADQERWEETLNRLKTSHEALKSETKKVAEEDLFSIGAGQKWTRFAIIQGVIHHLVYHTGQISYVRRLKAYDPQEFIG